MSNLDEDRYPKGKKEVVFNTSMENPDDYDSPFRWKRSKKIYPERIEEIKLSIIDISNIITFVIVLGWMLSRSIYTPSPLLAWASLFLYLGLPIAFFSSVYNFVHLLLRKRSFAVASLKFSLALISLILLFCPPFGVIPRAIAGKADMHDCGPSFKITEDGILRSQNTNYTSAGTIKFNSNSNSNSCDYS